MATVEVDLSRPSAPGEIVININNGDILADQHSPVNFHEIDNDHCENYWQWTICAVTAPFTVLGFPIHIIFGKSRISTGTSIFTSPNTRWLSSILDPTGQPIYFVFLTLALLITTAGFAMFVLIAFFTIFYHLVILGDINGTVAFNALNIFRVAPAVFPVIFSWLCGYSIKNLIRSFDSLRYELMTQQYNSGQEHRRTKLVYLPTGMYPKINPRRNLFWIYGIIVLAQVVYVLAEKSADANSNWVNYLVDIMYNFSLPLYCTFCWAISSQYKILASHLQIFQLTEAQPTFELLTEIKSSFKKVITLVHRVNDFFRVFMTWAIPVMVFAILVKLAYAIIFFFGYTVLENIIKHGLGVGTEESTEAPPTPADLEVAPALVRAAVGYLFVAIVQIYLLMYTIWEAVKVNDQARYLHVLLNDYGTQVAGKMTTEMYQAYRLLKYFMHSTMEQEISALLRLPILGVFTVCLPGIRSRLQGYDIRS